MVTQKFSISAQSQFTGHHPVLAPTLPGANLFMKLKTLQTGNKPFVSLHDQGRSTLDRCYVQHNSPKESPQKGQVNVFLSSVTSVMSNSLQSHGLQPARLLCPWESPGKNTGVGCHALLQGISPTEGLNPCLLHCSRFFTVEPPGKPKFSNVIN